MGKCGGNCSCGEQKEFTEGKRYTVGGITPVMYVADAGKGYHMVIDMNELETILVDTEALQGDLA